MKPAFLLVMLLFAITCFHVIVGNQKAKFVRQDTHEAFLFKSYRTIKQRIYIQQSHQEQTLKTLSLMLNLEVTLHTFHLGPGSEHPRKPRGYQPGRCDIFERAIFLGESLL